VQENSLEVFADDKEIHEGKSDTYYTGSQIVDRAKKSIGQDNYNVLWNNCEQFVIWCRKGEKIYISSF